MMINVIPNSEYYFFRVTDFVNAESVEDGYDGTNEYLHQQIHDGKLADYTIAIITTMDARFKINFQLAIHALNTTPEQGVEIVENLLKDSIDSDWLGSFEVDENNFYKIQSSIKPEEGDFFIKPINNPNLTGQNKVIWIYAYEGTGGTSFYWFPCYDDARRMYDTDKKCEPISLTQHNFFPLAVELDLSFENINEYVDTYHAENYFLEDFNESQSLESYPYTAEAWMDLVKKHD